MPYFGAAARSLSISSGPKGGGEDGSVAGSPTSSKNFSKPAGVMSTSILLGVAPTFLKACRRNLASKCGTNSGT